MGISIDTCLNLIKWMDLCDPARVSELEVLVAAALTDDAKAIHVPLPKGEFRRSKYRSLFAQEVQNLGESDKTLFKSILGPSHRLQYEQERALKKALVLYHWISSAPTKEIEEAHHLFFGAIKKMGEEFSWLIEAISALAKTEGWPEQVSMDESSRPATQLTWIQPAWKLPADSGTRSRLYREIVKNGCDSCSFANYARRLSISSRRYCKR
jgi:hypothetical protein